MGVWIEHAVRVVTSKLVLSSPFEPGDALVLWTNTKYSQFVAHSLDTYALVFPSCNSSSSFHSSFEVVVRMLKADLFGIGDSGMPSSRSVNCVFNLRVASLHHGCGCACLCVDWFTRNHDNTVFMNLINQAG